MTEVSVVIQKSLKARYARETRFRFYGMTAIAFALSVLVLLFITIISNGYSAFLQSKINLSIELSQSDIDPNQSGDLAVIGKANYRTLIFNAFRALFPEVKSRNDRRALTKLLSSGADFEVRAKVLEEPSLIGTTRPYLITLSDDADIFIKGHSTNITDITGSAKLSITSEDEAFFFSTAGDDFDFIRADIQQILKTRAQQAYEEITLKEAQEDRIVALLQGDVSEKKQKELLNLLEVTRRDINNLSDKARDLEQRSTQFNILEMLDPSMPGYFLVAHGGVVKIEAVNQSGIFGSAFLALESEAVADAGTWQILRFDTPEESRRISDKQGIWLWWLQQTGMVDTYFNTTFFIAGDSREPEQAGIWGAAVGSFLTLLVTLLLSFPIGVMAAVYLEEFAPKNKWTDLIEVNINNLAAVPSIVFGLLGLAVFLNLFGLPRSAPLVGGMVLTLMTLPTIIIAGRAALKSVPPSIREAALGMGASRLQVTMHHVLPLALPGMLTGTIIGMAQALGETAPLLMIGMVAFIVDIPGSMTDPATVLPVQIYLWADAPERAFVERTSAAIMVLLGFLILMNLSAVLLRKKFETRW